MQKQWFMDKTAGVARFWDDKMPMMAMEECGELIQAVSKRERYANFKQMTEVTHQALVTEMGDVMISIGALMSRYGIGLDELEDYIGEKLGKVYD